MATNPLEPPPIQTPLNQAESLNGNPHQDRGLVTLPWIIWLNSLWKKVNQAASIIADTLVSIGGDAVPGAAQSTSDLKGDHLSIRMFGATGDTRVFQGAVTAASTTYTSTTAAFTEADAGKRIIVYGAASAGRESQAASAVGGATSTNTYTEICRIDAQAATAVKFGANCALENVTWQVFGSNASNFSGEVSVHGPEALTKLEPSLSFVDLAPAYRYYRAKIVSTVPGVHGLGYVSAVAMGYVLGTTVASVTSATQVELTDPAGVTRQDCYTVMGTDDTAAIQDAIDYCYSRVVAGTADGGINLYVPEGNYLFSSPIDQKFCVTVRGEHGGACIFYADGEAMPDSVPLWNMTGTFASDSRIAFFTRLEDVRIDCGHVPNSVGVFADALQENSGIYRATVINWLKHGIQAGSSTDRYGCVNWMIQDPWVYPSNSAFLDDTVAGLYMEYAQYTTLIRGTYLGQGGLLCGYGKGIVVKDGIVVTTGQLHIESARIGLHLNTGSGGYIAAVDTQSFVETAVLIEGGIPTTIQSVFSLGKYSISYPYNSVLLEDSLAGPFVANSTASPAYMSAPVQMLSLPSNPNIVTWNPLNFGEPHQGGWFSVNSKSEVYPAWSKTSTGIHDDAMFVRMGATQFEIRIGPADQPIYVAQGTCDVTGTAVVAVTGDPFDTGWAAGSQIILGGLPGFIASVTDASHLTLTGAVFGSPQTGITFGVSTDQLAYGGTDPGKAWFNVLKDRGIWTPRIYFDSLTGATGPILFGNDITSKQARWMQSGSSQELIALERTETGGIVWLPFLEMYLDGGGFCFNGNATIGPYSNVAKGTDTLHVVNADVATGITTAVFRAGANQGSGGGELPLVKIVDILGVIGVQIFYSGRIEAKRLAIGTLIPSYDGFAAIENWLGIGNDTQDSDEMLLVEGGAIFKDYVCLRSGNASEGVFTDSNKKLVTAPAYTKTQVDSAIAAAVSGVSGSLGFNSGTGKLTWNGTDITSVTFANGLATAIVP